MKMKRILALLLTAMMLMAALSGCGGKKDSGSSAPATSADGKKAVVNLQCH